MAQHPGEIVPVPQIVAPELHDQPGIADQQHDADPRMDRSRPLAAAEQARQPEQHRVEHREARQHQQHEAAGGDPVVDPGRRCRMRVSVPLGASYGSSVQAERRSRPAVLRLQAIASLPSSSGCTSFGPATTQCKNPAMAAKAMPARATGLSSPFQAATKALILRVVRQARHRSTACRRGAEHTSHACRRRPADRTAPHWRSRAI